MATGEANQILNKKNRKLRNVHNNDHQERKHCNSPPTS
jgi:hypothetical protein